jgi:hypothetical protein
MAPSCSIDWRTILRASSRGQAHQVLHQHLVGDLLAAQPREPHVVVVDLELLLHDRAHLVGPGRCEAEARAHAQQVGCSTTFEPTKTSVRCVFWYSWAISRIRRTARGLSSHGVASKKT